MPSHLSHGQLCRPFFFPFHPPSQTPFRGRLPQTIMETELQPMRNNPQDFPPPPPLVDPQTVIQQQQEMSQHPIALFFHIFFKAASVFVFLFCGLFTDNFVLTFVTCVLLCAFDFWAVKNVTGRLLVGLRWWNEVSEDGTTKWIFESKPDSQTVSRFDSLIFWTAIYLTPIVWLVLGLIFTGFRLKWLLVVVVALVLSCANLVGYWKCQKDASAKIQSFITNRLVSAATGQLTGQQFQPVVHS